MYSLSLLFYILALHALPSEKDAMFHSYCYVYPNSSVFGSRRTNSKNGGNIERFVCVSVCVCVPCAISENCSFLEQGSPGFEYHFLNIYLDPLCIHKAGIEVSRVSNIFCFLPFFFNYLLLPSFVPRLSF